MATHLRNSLTIFCLILLVNVDSISADAARKTTNYSKQVEQVLLQKRKLIEELLSDAVVLEAVTVSNQTHQTISDAKIKELDSKWQATKGVDDFVKSFLTNPCAKQLINFQDNSDGFKEIFIADAKGLNVCQTNKTSDFYQADEAWWVDAFDSSKGKVGHGVLEYDESAKTEAISLYIPVIDPKTHVAIGVCKAVVDVTDVKESL